LITRLAGDVRDPFRVAELTPAQLKEDPRDPRHVVETVTIEGQPVAQALAAGAGRARDPLRPLGARGGAGLEPGRALPNPGQRRQDVARRRGLGKWRAVAGPRV